MNEQIIPVSTDLWLEIDTTKLANGGFFTLCSRIGGDVLIDKDEVPALIDVLHKFQDEYGTKEQVNG